MSRVRWTDPLPGLCLGCWRQQRDIPGYAVDVTPGGPMHLCAACIAFLRSAGFTVNLAQPEVPDADAFLKAVTSPQATIAERAALTLRRKEGA